MKYTNSLLELLIADESRTAILKEINESVLIKIASAMANATGGNILIGIDEHCDHITGISDSDVRLAINALSSKISPSLPYTFNVVSENEKKVLVISIWEGGKKPYTASDRFYVQVGDTVCTATLDQVNDLFDQRNRFDIGWERQPLPSIGYDKLSNNIFERLRTKLLETEKCSSNADISEVCGLMGFKSDSMLTNAGVVVMSRHPSEYLSQMRIRVSVFGKGGQEELVNVRLFDGNLVEDIDSLTTYILSYYPKRVAIVDNERKDVETLPKVALREGILNACIHRRFDSYNSFVAINLYADSVEIVNTGSLPDGMSIEDLSKKHRSILRNPDIANAFYVLGYIEAAGSGTQRILNECRKNYCATPIWKEQDDLIILTFPSVSHGLAAVTKRDWNAITTELHSDKGVSSVLAEILEYLTSHQMAKLAELCTITGKSYPTIKRHMQILKNADLVRYEGNARTGGWNINK